MAQKELKWYDILSILFGIILGFADPITDILTLVEFYRTDHKTWFGVGLCFITLPSFFIHSLITSSRTRNSRAGVTVRLLAYLVAIHFFPLL